MKRIIMLIFSFQLCILVCNAQYLRRESVFYPCLDIIVSNYYNYYFRFPDKVKDLIRFTECLYDTYPDWNNACDYNLKEKIIPYLKSNVDKILIEEEGYDYTIRIDSDTLLYVPQSFWPFSPCEDSLFIGGSPNEYYHFYEKFRIPRFYSSRDEAIFYPDSVYQDFKREVLNVQHRYIDVSNGSVPCKYYIYENDTVPISSMLEYNLGKPLRYYCSGEQVVSKLPFYAKLESFLKYFCKLHKCKQILFMLPDYNLSDDNHL